MLSKNPGLLWQNLIILILSILNHIAVCSIGWASLIDTPIRNARTIEGIGSLTPIAIEISIFIIFHIISISIFFFISSASATILRATWYWKLIAASVTLIALDYFLIGATIKYTPYITTSVMSGSMDIKSPYTIAIFIVPPIILTINLIIIISKTVPLLQKFKTTLSIIILLTPIIQENAIPKKTLKNYSTNKNHPNIIFIGFDSIARHQVDQYKDQMPFLSNHLSEGIDFKNTFTPIARTFPAWNSILTGQYPATSNMRFNLQGFENKKFSENVSPELITNILKKRGYTTIYAQDERRFNNIDEHYGFDKIVGPPVGAIDFIIPSLSDNLFSSYFLQSSIGRLVLPSLYINRGAPYVYDPNEFVDQILKAVAQPSENPTFIAIHFCIAHFPYTWKNTPFVSYGRTEEQLHPASAKMADQQFKKLFTGLKSTGFLDNAVIVTLSDHGEGIGNPRNWIGDANGSTGLERIMRGHGNSLMSPDQVKVILNFNIYGKKKIIPQSTSNFTSLVDIKPTVLEIIGFDSNYDSDGVSLISHDMSIKNHQSRSIFMETGLPVMPPTPGASLAEKSEAIKNYSMNYQLSDNGKIELKQEKFDFYISQKQFAVVRNNHILVKDCQQGITSEFELNSLYNGKNLDKISPDMLKNLNNYIGNNDCNIINNKLSKPISSQ